MAVEEQSRLDPVEDLLSEMARLRGFGGPPAEFWPAYLGAAGRLTGASVGVLLLKNAATGDGWKKLGQWTGNGQADRSSLAFLRQLAELADRSAEHGNFVLPVDAEDARAARSFGVAARLPLPSSGEACVAAMFLAGVTEPSAREALLRLRLVADAPLSYLQHAAAAQARADVEKMAGTLDLLAQVNAEKRYLAAALAFCNALATRHQCDRVSLGWVDHGYVRLQAISRTERFDKQMAAVKAIEAAMEEAFDQDEELAWPGAEATTAVTRDHEALAKAQGIEHLCSIPLRLDDSVVGVVLCERRSQAFTDQELRQLRLAADQAVRRLADLKRQDRWFGARWAAATRERMAKFLGVERTWAKALALLAAALLLALVIVRVDYRVEADFVLQSDETAFIAVPFDGFIDEVHVRISDPVRAGQPLLSLARDQLELDESAAVADLTRFTREAEKARAGNALADMRIAQALADQARARLDLIRYRLEQAVLKSPFEGVVAEGDQKERIGAPVKQGEMLFKVARMDHLYVEADVDERDVHEVGASALGEIAFASQPKLKFPVRVLRVRPAAQPKEGVNVFVARCEITVPAESWWRPGMSGVCKIEAGRRSLIWILSHRTIDYLRMLFWW